MTKIERSQGTPTGTPVFPLCGNGYEGATSELDGTVARAAEMLAAEYGRDIEIRFNSDQRGGGAFLKNSLKGFAGNCQVKLGASLQKIVPENWEGTYRTGEWYSLPELLQIDTYVAADCLFDPSIAVDGTENNPRSSVHHATLQDGLNWLRANVDPAKVLA